MPKAKRAARNCWPWYRSPSNFSRAATSEWFDEFQSHSLWTCPAAAQYLVCSKPYELAARKTLAIRTRSQRSSAQYALLAALDAKR